MIPEAGDIAWFDFNPVKGTEQAGRRPGLILTTAGYHERSGRAVVCPITSKGAHWTFNVTLPAGLKTKGWVLVDQVRTVERADRMFDWIETVPAELLAEVRGRLAALLNIYVDNRDDAS